MKDRNVLHRHVIVMYFHYSTKPVETETVQN